MPGTVERYHYELRRLLTNINKAIKDMISDDISGHMRAYKAIRQVLNQTLKNVRACYGSFFAWILRLPFYGEDELSVDDRGLFNCKCTFFANKLTI